MHLGESIQWLDIIDASTIVTFLNSKTEPRLSICESGTWSCSDSGCGSDFVCPTNQIRSDHVTQCEPKCSSLHHITTLPGSCDGPVWSGCKCPVGLVLHNQTCIEPDQCPCLHNGEVFEPGATITRDCNTCVCERRAWTCTKNKCAATCSAVGDPHYETFDGLEYTFQGSCSYILASHIDGDFLVTAENVACGSTGVTCTKCWFVCFSP